MNMVVIAKNTDIDIIVKASLPALDYMLEQLVTGKIM